MHLLFFVQYFPPEKASGLTIITDILEGFADYGWKVDVYVPMPTRGVSDSIRKQYYNKRVEKWKRGFYQIAMEAGVPISLGFIDYHTRTCGIMSIFQPTGDYEKDLAEIQAQYYGLEGYKKGQFNLEDKPHAHPEWYKL